MNSSLTHSLTYLIQPPRDPTNWLSFTGRWGDRKYNKDDPPQKCFLGIDELCMYASGPTGPADKQLDRKDVCPDNGKACIPYPILVQ